jgi:hypothetical protein
MLVPPIALPLRAPVSFSAVKEPRFLLTLEGRAIDLRRWVEEVI